jgi:hypothetical protein
VQIQVYGPRKVKKVEIRILPLVDAIPGVHESRHVEEIVMKSRVMAKDKAKPEGEEREDRPINRA